QRFVVGTGERDESFERDARGPDPRVLAQREPCRERRVVTAATREEFTDPVREVAFVGCSARGRETEATVVTHVRWFSSIHSRKPRFTRVRDGYDTGHDHSRPDPADPRTDSVCPRPLDQSPSSGPSASSSSPSVPSSDRRCGGPRGRRKTPLL